jgi:pyruvate kinase
MELPMTSTPENLDLAGRCLDQLSAIRADLLASERYHAPLLQRRALARSPSVRNFIHYLALRRRDVRSLQEDLARLGLSSLGRAESHTLHTVEAVLEALGALTGSAVPTPDASGAPSFDTGPALLAENTAALLGPRPSGRGTRIMVTLPGEASRDLPLVRSLVERGMNVARINCAHDDADIWAGLAAAVRDAARMVGRPCLVQMDLGGPKLRTGPCAEELTVRAGDLLLLTRAGERGAPASTGADGVMHPARIACSLPEVLDQVRPGDRLFFDDGKIGALIELVDESAARVRITQAKGGGSRLRADKGINLPDSELDLPALTRKDRTDLESVVRLADIVALSFAERSRDVADLEAELVRLGATATGLVLKIETRRGFSRLPSLLLEAIGTRPVGAMIARGDMAVECGYERLAEIQEEMLWLCEAAHVPVIWATQVLDRLSRKGLPTRAEITDAAMAERAECVMLNKGPHIHEAIGLLDGILRRMEGHQHKKISTLRPLAVSHALSD